MLADAVWLARTEHMKAIEKELGRSLDGTRPKHGSHISWTWKIGTRTTPGRWPIYVTCGQAGSTSTSIRVG